MHSFTLPLAGQIEMVFREIRNELSYLSSGTVFIQIRNNDIGKFGVRHIPLESRDGKVKFHGPGLSETQQNSFRRLAIEALKYKNWTHGEIHLDFMVKQNLLYTSIQFESNYNMSNLLANLEKKKAYKKTVMD